MRSRGAWLVMVLAASPLHCARAAQGDWGEHGVREALRTVYARPGDTFLWSRDGRPTAQATALLGELSAAERFGLNPADYAADAIAASGGAMAESGARERYETSLSVAALRFVVDLHYGRVDPIKADFRLQTARRALDLVAVLENLSTTQDVVSAIAAVEPQFEHYSLLKQALQHYRRLAIEQAALPPLSTPPGHALRSGDRYPGAPALRALLRLVGDLPDDQAVGAANLIVDPGLIAAVQRFQSRHGLAVDGAIGKATFAALSTPLTRRVRQIELTLERWRWLPAFETPPIIVNIPQFRLFAFRSTQDLKADILQMDVIVGRTYSSMQTPVFAADMRYVIFRPYWDVPQSITRREMLPKLERDPQYLTRQHLEIVQGSDDTPGRQDTLPPTAENLAALAEGRLRLRQQPGADNALGLIKFVLPNAYDVYLHSTPAHQLFAESRRAFSHGCIRVSDPVALAVHVLRETPGEWTPEKVQAAMNGTETLRVELARPIRVMILYGTALALESGEVLFFDDIYGHDRRLEALLDVRSSGAHESPRLRASP